MTEVVTLRGQVDALEKENQHLKEINSALADEVARLTALLQQSGTRDIPRVEPAINPIICNCTAQCPECGACCQVSCAHRGVTNYRIIVTDHTSVQLDDAELRRRGL